MHKITSRKDIAKRVHSRLDGAMHYFLVLDCFDIISQHICSKLIELENVFIPGFGIFYPSMNPSQKPPRTRKIKFQPDQQLISLIKKYQTTKESKIYDS